LFIVYPVSCVAFDEDAFIGYVMSWIGNSCVKMHHFLLFCRLRDEFEEIAEKALTTPANTKELMELKAYIEKVESEIMYDLEKKLLNERSILEFLIEHTSFTAADMRSNTDTFMWYDRMSSIFDEHRAIIAEKWTQFEEGLKVCLHIL